MKRLLAGLAFLFAVGAAVAQVSLPFPGPGSGSPAGGGPVTVSFVTNSGVPGANCSTSCSFTLNIGTASPGRYVLAAIACVINSGTYGTNPFSAVTIDGISATQVGNQVRGQGNQGVGAFFIVLDNGSNTLAPVAFTQANASWCVVYTYNLFNLLSTTATDTQSGTSTGSSTVATSAPLTVNSNGVGIVGCGTVNNVAVSSFTNMTKDSNVTGANPGGSAVGSTSTAGSNTITCTFASSPNENGINTVALR